MKSEFLLDSSADGIFVFDKQYVTIAWNKKLEMLFGLLKKNNLNKSILKSPLFVNNLNFECIIQQVLAGESHISYHNVFTTISGDHIYYYTLTIEPVRDDNDNIIGGMGTAKDIVSVDKMNSIYSFNDIVHNDTTLPKIVFSTDGKPIYFNESYKTLWGLTPRGEQFVLNNYNLFQDEQLTGLDLLNQFRLKSEGICGEVPILDYDTQKTSSLRKLKGKRKKLSGYIHPNKNKLGEVSGLEVTLVDLSEEGQQNFSNPIFVQKFQKLTNNLPGVIYEYNTESGTEGTFNYISQSCNEVFGVTDYQIKQYPKLLKQLIHTDDIVSYLQSVKKAEDSFSDWEWEGRFVVNGKIKWIRGSSRPEKINGNAVVRYGLLIDITAEKQAQLEQKAASKRLKLALDGANMGLWDWEINRDTFIINNRFAEILGYTKKQLNKELTSWLDFVHPEEKENIQRKVINHLKGKTEFLDLEMQVKTKPGQWMWVMIKAQVTDRSSEGKALRMAGTIQDVNKRKQYERILAQSEARYRGLVEHSPVAIVVYRNDQIVFANDQTYRLLCVDWEKEDLIGMDLLDFVSEENREKAKDRIYQIFRSKKPSNTVEEKLMRRDGKEIIVEMVGIPFEDEGEPAIQIIASDITDKITTQKILKRSEQLLSQLFESAPIGIVLLDASKRVVQINKGFRDIFGYSNEEAFGKKLNQLIIPKGYRGQAINLNTLIAEGNVVKEVESIRMDKDGNLIPVMIYGVPVTVNGKVIAIYGIYVDVTSSKKIEEELKVRNEELDNFVYKVSHDLRAPLSSTLGLIHLANLEQNNDDLRQYMQFIKERISQLDRFITDVLSHSKNLNVEIKLSEIDLESIINRCFEGLDYLSGADSVQKRVSIKGVKFYNDNWRMEEVMRNLISNAIKYMNLDIDDSYVDIDINITKKKAIFIFSDNGIGISEEMLPRIFEMFYRATESSQGSGIGLYIVKNAVTKMGGKIDIESVPDKGTTFKIELPNKTI